jgi:hypothetical protein
VFQASLDKFVRFLHSGGWALSVGLGGVPGKYMFYTATESGTIVDVTSELTSPDDFATLYNGDNSGIFNFNSGQQFSGATLFRIEYRTTVELSSVFGGARWLSGQLPLRLMRAVGWASRPYRGVSKVKKLFVIGINSSAWFQLRQISRICFGGREASAEVALLLSGMRR